MASIDSDLRSWAESAGAQSGAFGDGAASGGGAVVGHMRPDIAAVVEELVRCSPAFVEGLLDELRRVRAERETGEGEPPVLRLVGDGGAT